MSGDHLINKFSMPYLFGGTESQTTIPLHCIFPFVAWGKAMTGENKCCSQTDFWFLSM